MAIILKKKAPSVVTPPKATLGPKTKQLIKSAGKLPKVELPEEQETETTDPKQMSLKQLVDVYGTLEDQVMSIQPDPRIAQLAAAKAELDKRITALNLKPTEVKVLKGTNWAVNVEACKKKPRELIAGAIPTIQAYLGDDTFYDVAKVTLGDVEKYLTKEQAAEVIKEDTGYNPKRAFSALYLGE